MTNRTAEISPAFWARVAGFLYLILFVCGPFSMLYVPSTLIVPGDATATAANIVSTQWLFRLGIVGYAVIFLTDIGLSAIFYVLLRPVSPTLSLIAAFSRLAQAIFHGVNLMYSFTALLLLSGAGYLTVFEPGQMQALAYVFLTGHESGVLISQVFFGFHCLVLGYLLYRSSYFPSLLGVLMVLASLGYLIQSLGTFLLPQYAEVLAVVVVAPAVIGEMSLTVWLLVKGVRVSPEPA